MSISLTRKMDKRITDTFFEVSAEEKKKYHWECESGTDRSILARFFEYDAQIALDSGKIEEGVLVLDFPNSAVLELRAGKSIGDIKWQKEKQVFLKKFFPAV